MGTLTQRIERAEKDSTKSGKEIEGLGQVDEREKAIVDRHKSELPSGGLMQKIATGLGEMEIKDRRQKRAYAEKPPTTMAQITAPLTRDMLSNLGDRARVLAIYRNMTPDQRQEALKLAPGIAQIGGDDRGGFTGRVGSAIARGITGVSQPIIELAGQVTGTDWGGSTEEIEFIRQLEGAAAQEFNPALPGDPWYERGPLQALEMAIPMATSISGAGLGKMAATKIAGKIASSAAAGSKAAGMAQKAGQAVGSLPTKVPIVGKYLPAVTAGKVGELAGITAAGFPAQYAQEVDQLKAIGMVDDTRLRLLAGGTAAVTSLVEGLVPNPFGGNVSLKEGAIKAARQYLWESAKKAPGELTEEYLQGVVSGVGEHVAQHIGSEVGGVNPAQKKSIADAFSKGWKQTQEAALPMAFLLGGSAIGGASIAAGRARKAPPTLPPPPSESPPPDATSTQPYRTPVVETAGATPITLGAKEVTTTPTTPVTSGSQDTDADAKELADLQEALQNKPNGEVWISGEEATTLKIKGTSRKERTEKAKSRVSELKQKIAQGGMATLKGPTDANEAPANETSSVESQKRPARKDQTEVTNTSMSLQEEYDAIERKATGTKEVKLPDGTKISGEKAQFLTDAERLRLKELPSLINEARKLESEQATSTAQPKIRDSLSPVPPTPADVRDSVSQNEQTPQVAPTAKATKPPAAPIERSQEQVDAQGRVDAFVNELEQTNPEEHAVALTNPIAALDTLIEHHKKNLTGTNLTTQQYAKGAIARFESLKRDYEVSNRKADDLSTEVTDGDQARQDETEATKPITKALSKDQGKKASEPATAAEKAPTEPVKPGWDVIKGADGKLYHEDPNPNLKPSQRVATRVAADPKRVTLVTKDFRGEAIPDETLQARREFVDNAQEGATFRRPGFNKNALFEVGKDGKIYSIESTTKRESSSVQDLVNNIQPGDITDLTKPSEAKSRDSVSQKSELNQEKQDAPKTKKGGDISGKIETEGQTKAQTQTQTDADGREGLLSSKEEQASEKTPSPASSRTSLPPLKEGHSRFVHIGRPGIEQSMKDGGLDYSGQGIIQSTARNWSNESEVEYTSDDARFADGTAYVFDVPNSEVNQHFSMRSAPGVLPGKHYVGAVPSQKSSTAKSAQSAASSVFDEDQNLSALENLPETSSETNAPSPTAKEPEQVAAKPPAQKEPAKSKKPPTSDTANKAKAEDKRTSAAEKLFDSYDLPQLQRVVARLAEAGIKVKAVDRDGIVKELVEMPKVMALLEQLLPKPKPAKSTTKRPNPSSPDYIPPSLGEATMVSSENLTDSEKKQVDILNKMGVDLRFIENDNWSLSGLFDPKSMTIWINRSYTRRWNNSKWAKERGPEAMTWGLFAHEAFHAIRKSKPKLWNDLYDWVKKNDSKGLEKAGRDYFNQMQTVANKGNKDALRYVEELKTDEDAFNNEALSFYLENEAGKFEFWNELGETNPGLLAKIGRWLLRALRFAEPNVIDTGTLAGQVRLAIESAMKKNNIATTRNRGQRAGVGMTDFSLDKINAEDIRAKDRPGKRVSKGLSMRTVKGVKTFEETEDLSLEYVKKNEPKIFIKNANVIAEYPLVAGKQKFKKAATIEQAQEIYDVFIREAADNLNYLFSKYKPELRTLSTLWYDGANAMANDMAARYTVSPEQVSGIIAAMSPQKDWYQNVRCAELLLDAFKVNPVFTSQMVDYLRDVVHVAGINEYEKEVRKASKAVKKSRTNVNKATLKKAEEDLSEAVKKAEAVTAMLRGYVGKTLDSVPEYVQPYVVRLHHEINTTKDYKVIAPDGSIIGDARNDDGKKARLAWGSFGEIGKAVSIRNNGSPENITRRLGVMHKIRNFYNNIIDPMSKDGDVTMDTHAIAAALLMPLSSKSSQVSQNFGSGGVANSGPFGIKGLYYAFAEAYNVSAKENGLLPRQVQSATWDPVRGLFTDVFKSDKKNVAKIDDIWREYQDGKATIDETRRQVFEAAGGISDPTWARPVQSEPGEGTRKKSVRKRGGRDGQANIGIASGARSADGTRAGVGRQRPESTGDGRGREESRKLKALAGSPSVPGINGPDSEIVAVAERYAKENGIDLKRQAEYVQVDPDRAKRIADAYEQMAHAPQDPKVKEAYQELIKQTTAQYKALEDAGYKFWFMDLDVPSNAEYASSPYNALRDLRNNKQMGVFPTSDGFGTSDLDVNDNPLLADTGIKWPSGGVDGPLRSVTANDLFRAVHDAFGHSLEGAGFRARGEENAWQAHVRLFTGSAVGAITSETRGQNSWLNYGPYGDKNRDAKVEDTTFADQKTGLMPEWTWTEGRAADYSETTNKEIDDGGEIRDGTRASVGRGDKDIYGDSGQNRRGFAAVPRYGKAREGSVSYVGRHYSKQPRKSLDVSFRGTGIPGAENKRLRGSSDDRIKQRVYFYIDTAGEIKPEAGVGSFAHEVQLDNLYDPESKLFPHGSDSNSFESAVIDAGFDGYISKLYGMAVLLGPQHANVPVSRATEYDAGASDLNGPDLNSGLRYGVARPEVAKKLNVGKKVKLYRAMYLIDGNLYPPMSSRMKDDTGKLTMRSSEQIGQWMQSEERPDLVPKTGKHAGKFPLQKPKGITWAAYAPYFHASPMPLNDQFTASWNNDGVKRPRMVIVEVEVPASEMTSGYQAEGSTKKVGTNKWNAGVVASKIPGGREVVLSRYLRINRVVPDAEVAKKIAEVVNPNRLSIPENTVTPQLRAELEKNGVKISPKGTKGKGIRYSPARQTDTPEFKKWFGDSKVVDADGKPLVVYHGTDEKFSEFESGRKSQRSVMLATFDVNTSGFFFSPSEKDASEYGKNVLPVYLAVQSRLMDPEITDISSRSSNDAKAASIKAFEDAEYILEPMIYEEGGKRWIDTGGGISNTEVDTEGNWVSEIFIDGMIDWHALDNPQVVERMKERGYDGVKVLENNDSSGESWFVVNPTQVKSATSNVGTFDPTNPDIRYSPGKQEDMLDWLLRNLEDQGVIKPEQKPQPESTGTKYAKTEGQRTSVGDSPREWFGPRDVEERQQRALAELAANPGRPYEIVAQMDEKPRPLTDMEDALLNARIRELKNDGDIQGDDRKEWLDINRTVQRGHSEWGYAGHAAQAELTRDFSIEGLTQKHSRHVGNDPKPEQLAKYADLADKIDKLEAEKLELADKLAKEAIARKKAEAAKPKPKPSQEKKGTKRATIIKKVADGFAAFQDAWGGGSSDRAAVGRQESQQDRDVRYSSSRQKPDVTAAATSLVAALREMEVSSILELEKQVKANMPNVTPEQMQSIRDAWDASVKKTKITSPIGDNPDKSAIGARAKELMTLAIEAGYGATEKTWKDVVDVVHAQLSTEVPGISVSDTMQAMSDYGVWRPLNKEEVAAKIRAVRGKARQSLKIEDTLKAIEKSKEWLEQGVSPEEVAKRLQDMNLLPKATGSEQATPDSIERELIAEFNKLKKELPVSAESKDGQLKSALTTAKTTAQNKLDLLNKDIKALEEAIAGSKELDKPIDKRTALKPDEDLLGIRKQLEDKRKQRDDLKAKYEEIFPSTQPKVGRKELTDEQKLAMSERMLKSSIDAVKKEIDALQDGSWSPSDKKAAPTSEIKEALQAELAVLKEARNEAKKASPVYQATQEAKYWEQYRKSQEKRLAFWEKRRDEAATGTLPTPRKKRTITEEAILDKNLEIEKVQYEAMYEIEKAKRANWNAGQWIGYGLLEATSLIPKTLMLGMEMSFVLRQGFFYSRAHPIKAFTAVVESIPAVWSQRLALASVEGIESRPNAKEYELGGIEFTKKNAPAAQLEEMYQSAVIQWLENSETKLLLPFRAWVKAYGAFERGNRTFANIMKADLYDIQKRDTLAARELFGKSTEWTENDIVQTGRITNIFSGRGTGLKGGSPWLDFFFLARRWMWSRIQADFVVPFQLATPQWIGQWNADRGMRTALAKLYIQTLLGHASKLAMGYFVYSLLADDDEEEKPTIEWDPRSSDAWALKIGETRLKDEGGLMPAIVLASRVLSGKIKTGDGEIKSIYGEDVQYGGRTAADFIVNFARYKIGTGPSAILEWASGQDAVGNPVTKTGIITSRLTPLTWREVAAAEEELGVAKGTLAALEAFFGVSVNTRGDRTKYRQANETEREELFDKNLKKMSFDSPDPAYKDMLTEKQMLQVNERRAERKQGLVYAAAANPIRKSFKTDKTFEQAVKERDAALGNLKKSGITLDESRKLLIEHWESSYGSARETRGGIRVYKEALSDRLKQLRKVYAE